MVISEDDNESCSPRENSDDAKWEFRRSRIKSTLPEKIVFLVDIHEEMGEPWNSSYETRMVAIKDGKVNIFLFDDCSS